MFGRKMKNSLSALAPQKVVDLKGKINKNKIKQVLEKVKLRYDKKYNSTEITLKPGDSIKIKKNNGEYSQPKTVIRCGKMSVFTSDGKKWPLDKVSIRQRYLQSPN